MKNNSWEREALLDILNFIKDDEEANFKKAEILNRLKKESRDTEKKISIVTVIDNFVVEQYNVIKVQIEPDLVETVQSLDKESLRKEVNMFLRELIK